MQPPPPPKPRRPARRLRDAIVTIAIIVVAAVVLWPGWRMARESARRGSCLSNVRHLGLGIMQYSEDYGGSYPWRVAATDPADAWRDLGLLFPDYYVSESKPFFCPSSRDRRSQVERAFFRQVRDARQQGRAELFQLPSAGSRVVISYSYSYNAMGVGPEGAAIAPRPWGRDRSSSARLLADKKAGVAMTPESNHWWGGGGGRNVLGLDGFVKWKADTKALDPDEESKTIGAPDALDYRAWWSDPPYYGE